MGERTSLIAAAGHRLDSVEKLAPIGKAFATIIMCAIVDDATLPVMHAR